MKLARVGEKGQERPVAIDSEGRPRWLVSHFADLTPELLSPEKLAGIAGIDIESLPVVEGRVRYGVPIAGTRKLIAIGLNYRDHAREAKLPEPAEPLIFMKAITSLAGANDDVPMPPNSSKMDWEVELGIVIGSHARFVPHAEALDRVAGYVLVNDISERAHQMERGGTWDKGKGHDGFGPVGPWFVSRDELGDASGLSMFLDVSGERLQTGNTSDMIFDVATIVSYVSEFMSLEPGDMIATGTPAGVGLGMSPPRFLRPGDEMRLGIECLGEQHQRVVSLQTGQAA